MGACARVSSSNSRSISESRLYNSTLRIHIYRVSSPSSCDRQRVLLRNVDSTIRSPLLCNHEHRGGAATRSWQIADNRIAFHQIGSSERFRVGYDGRARITLFVGGGFLYRGESEPERLKFWTNADGEPISRAIRTHTFSTHGDCRSKEKRRDQVGRGVREDPVLRMFSNRTSFKRFRWDESRCDDTKLSDV